MKKLKIYLDTSVISHLYAEDAPVEMEQTLEFWENAKSDKYEIFLSPTVFEEISKNKEPKRNILYSYIDEILYTMLEQTKAVEELVEEYFNKNILPKRSVSDRFHIAYSVLADCDLLLSWNFNHLANINTMEKIKIVNSTKNYKPMLILPPIMLLGKEY